MLYQIKSRRLGKNENNNMPLIISPNIHSYKNFTDNHLNLHKIANYAILKNETLNFQLYTYALNIKVFPKNSTSLNRQLQIADIQFIKNILSIHTHKYN